MDLNLDGKVAWVAGGTGWLGQATARALVAEGARVGGAATSSRLINSLAPGPPVRPGVDKERAAAPPRHSCR